MTHVMMSLRETITLYNRTIPGSLFLSLPNNDDTMSYFGRRVFVEQLRFRNCLFNHRDDLSPILRKYIYYTQTTLDYSARHKLTIEVKKWRSVLSIPMVNNKWMIEMGIIQSKGTLYLRNGEYE